MLAERCRHDFAQLTESRGREYFQSKRVTYLEVDGTAATADVTGSGGQRYTVDISWAEAPKGVLHASCTCVHFEDGFLCKHIWAVLLELDQRQYSKSIPGFGELEVEAICVEDDEIDDCLDDDPDVDGYVSGDVPDAGEPVGISYHDLLQRTANGTAKPASTPPSGWRQRLTQVKRSAAVVATPSTPLITSTAKPAKQLWYVVNVADSQRQKAVVVDYMQRPLKKDGQWGKFRPYSVPRFRLTEITDPQDRELIGMLLSSDGRQTGAYSASPYYGYGYGYSSNFYDSWLTPTMAEMILPRLCETGRCIWALSDASEYEDCKPSAWDDGAPWRVVLDIESDTQKQHWRIQGKLARGEQFRSLDEAILLNTHVVLFPDTWARVDGGSVCGWGESLRADNMIQVPFSERDEFLNSLAELPQLPEAVWPDDLIVETAAGEPSGMVRLTQSKMPAERKYWYAHVLFDYQGETFSTSDGIGGAFNAESNRLIRRDGQRERDLMQQLDALSVTRPTAYEIRQLNADRKVHERHLPQVVETLTRLGWQVEAEGAKIRRPGQVRLSVSSDVDWFELDGAVDFDGVSASLPDLLKAVRNEQNYVLLDDGTRGLLPEEWLRKYGKLAEMGAAEGDSLRFAPSQAMLLDALLAAQEQDLISVDSQFDEFRSRLRSFEGVKPVNPPEGFQGTLRDYQRDGLGWLHFLREFGLGGCLADDMGLGKTVQVLALLESRRQERAKTVATVESDQPENEDAAGHELTTQRPGPSLVIVPKSLIFNWIEEAERFTPELKVLNYTGLSRADAREQLDDYDVVVTTYGTLRRDVVELKDRPFDYVILDESQAIKNSGSQASKAVRLLNAKHRLAMTGTPVENHLGELWSLFEFLNPGMLGRSRVFASLSKSGTTDDHDWLRLLAQALRPFMLRRTKKQVLTELPEKTEQTLHCEMSTKERKKYNELRDYYRAQLNDRVAKHGLQKSKIHVLEALLRLRQAACHPGLLDKKKTNESSAKLDTLFEQLDEVISEGHKVLVFSQFTSLLAIVRGHLDKRKVTYEYLDGRTQKRGERVKRFQEDPDCPLFLISLKAGGHGLNLTAADYVFILDPWWNPAVEAQAVDRAHRIGQNRHVFAYRLICKDTVEDKIIELQKSKRELADAIVSADESLLRSLTSEDLALLFE